MPLFCLPGLIVNTREFQPLARAVQGDRPVYAFVSHVYTRKRWRGFAIRELAAEYADFIVATATSKARSPPSDQPSKAHRPPTAVLTMKSAYSAASSRMAKPRQRLRV